MPKFCNKCGKELNDNAKFCNGCGNNMGDMPASQQQIAQAPNGPGVTDYIQDKLKKPIKYYTGIIITIVLLLVSLFPLIYNPELSDMLGDEESDYGSNCMNGNLFMIFKILKYVHALGDTFKDTSIASLTLPLLVVGATLMFVLAIINIAKAITSVHKSYISSNEHSDLAMVFIGIAGLLCVLTMLSFNMSINGLVNKQVSKYETYIDDQDKIDEYKEELHEDIDDYKYKLSLPALILMVGGFAGKTIRCKFTYEYEKEYMKQRANQHYGDKTPDSVVMPEGEWRCDYCGKTNKSGATSCANCYHKRQ